ncbi:hypothetical protein W02_17970 [Nitrospira sp. KM1]|nr:hypothetical protein W02_17970 [Nitrospira sp. KM1]
MIPRSLILILALLWSVSGCIPVKYTYYEPEILGVKVERRGCRGTEGPRDAIELTHEQIAVSYVGDSTLSYFSYLDDHQNPSLRLYFSIPNDHVVTLALDK